MRATAPVAGRALLVAIGVTVVLCGGPVVAQDEVADAGGGGRGDHQVTFARVEIEVGERSVVPLSGDHTMLLPGQDGQARAVPVELVTMPCSYELEFAFAGKTYQRSSESRLLYELRSREPEVPHTWAVFADPEPWGPRGFRLAAIAPGENYLASVIADGITAFEVTQPRDRYEALKRTYSPQMCEEAPDNWFHVSATDVVREESAEPGHWFGVHATRWDIVLLAFGRDEDGTWVIKVHGTNPEPVFTLTSTDRETWHLQQQPQEPAAP